MHLRARREDDLDALAEVGLRVRAVDGYPVYLPNGDYRAILRYPDPIDAWLAVDDDDRMLGHVALHPSTSTVVIDAIRAAGIDGPLGVISRLLVDPTHRRAGLAATLLDTARRRAIELGLTPVLDVIATSVAPITLYRREGWTELGRVTYTFPDGQVVDELVFRGPLTT